MSEKETMRDKFNRWYESDHGQSELRAGMLFTGWAYSAYAAGYTQAAKDLLAPTPTNSGSAT